MDRQSDRLPRQTRCEGMRIEREIQMGAAGGGQSIKASGHWPREQAGHKPATGMTVLSQNALDPRRASTQVPSSAESGANHGAAEATWAQPDASHTIIFIAGLEDHRVPLWARKLQLEVFSFRRSRRYDNECSLCPLKGYHGYPT